MSSTFQKLPCGGIQCSETKVQSSFGTGVDSGSAAHAQGAPSKPTWKGPAKQCGCILCQPNYFNLKYYH